MPNLLLVAKGRVLRKRKRKQKRSRGTLITDSSGSRQAWRKRLPFIIAFVNGKRVECKSPVDAQTWTKCWNNCFGYGVDEDLGYGVDEDRLYRIRVNGKTVSPAAYMRSLKFGKRKKEERKNNDNGKPSPKSAQVRVRAGSRFRQFDFKD